MTIKIFRNYGILGMEKNDVLGQHRSRPAFKALDPDMQEKIYYLYTHEEIKKNRI